MVRKVSKKLHRTHKKKYLAGTKRLKNKSIRTKRRSRKMRYDRGFRGGQITHEQACVENPPPRCEGTQTSQSTEQPSDLDSNHHETSEADKSDGQTQLPTTPTKSTQKKAEEYCIKLAFDFFEDNCFNNKEKTPDRLSYSIREKAQIFYTSIIRNIRRFGLHDGFLAQYKEIFGDELSKQEVIDEVKAWTERPFTENYPLYKEENMEEIKERLQSILDIQPCPAPS
jgi:hypothetical protein